MKYFIVDEPPNYQKFENLKAGRRAGSQESNDERKKGQACNYAGEQMTKQESKQARKQACRQNAKQADNLKSKKARIRAGLQHASERFGKEIKAH